MYEAKITLTIRIESGSPSLAQYAAEAITKSVHQTSMVAARVLSTSVVTMSVVPPAEYVLNNEQHKKLTSGRQF